MPVNPLTKNGIPKIFDLCTDLQYPKVVMSKLLPLVQEWRDNYRDKSGKPEKSLLCWQPQDGNHELKRMAKQFLNPEHGNHGNQLWPPGHGVTLEYPRDEERQVSTPGYLKVADFPSFEESSIFLQCSFFA